MLVISAMYFVISSLLQVGQLSDKSSASLIHIFDLNHSRQQRQPQPLQANNRINLNKKLAGDDFLQLSS
jgi:hypothetical protein